MPREFVNANYSTNDDEMDFQLTASIEMSLVRGVSVSTLLRGLGRVFQTTTGSLQVKPEDYELSVPANHLDDFISHDWASARWKKTICLWLVYNGSPAEAGSLLVAAVLCLLQTESLGFLPRLEVSAGHTNHMAPPGKGRGIWCQVLCPFVFMLILFCWQTFRPVMFSSRRMVFLDKYCIDQCDQHRRKAGILGLGGFLKHSSRLLICWTPRYFTRLWCTYEVASWLHLNKPMDAILFIPLNETVALFLLAGIIWIFCLALAWRLFSEGTGFEEIWWNGIVTLCICASLVIQQGAPTYKILKNSIAEFSIKNAECYCCSHNHRHPESNALLPCDRALVYKTLQGWFPGDDLKHVLQEQSDLKEFDSLVQGLVGPCMLDKAGTARLRYSYLVLVGWPLVFRAFDMLVDYDEDGWAVMSSFFGHCSITFISIPLTIKASLMVLPCIDKTCWKCKTWVGGLWTTLLGIILVNLVVWLLVFFPMLAGPWSMTVAAIIELSALYWLFTRDNQHKTHKWPGSQTSITERNGL